MGWHLLTSSFIELFSICLRSECISKAERTRSNVFLPMQLAAFSAVGSAELHLWFRWASKSGQLELELSERLRRSRRNVRVSLLTRPSLLFASLVRLYRQASISCRTFVVDVRYSSSPSFPKTQTRQICTIESEMIFSVSSRVMSDSVGL